MDARVDDALVPALSLQLLMMYGLWMYDPNVITRTDLITGRTGA